MKIELYPHNQFAYDSATALMKHTGKAAVIHPTGTGKSFIGFRLCADNPEKRCFWLSPSEYIFKTQIDNLKSATGGYLPNNVHFCTYAKLMQMQEEELQTIRPDVIILDEFHRCGAQMWGGGVLRLLSRYPKAPILGLSATNIRYLDNQRDMAMELFDGNVASEMTLGEAIVRGILCAPKYVLSVFSCKKNLEHYETRTKKTKNRMRRSTAEIYLEDIRRSLENTDGLEEVFSKHIENASGKYLVFCANKEHMDEMKSLAPKWFQKVDRNPHIYAVYAEDSGSSVTFDAFREDNSEHLKLLYCIDMLNEGIHVEDVDGVILLRPTVSPIIYKQQIGRALTTGKKTQPVIFDIVLNIENLYSIGTIEEEMQAATAYYRALGMEHRIVNERIHVVDEVRECMELFENLNNSLCASWELMYHYAKRYLNEHGNLLVPKRYITREGYSLGAWLQTQRMVYAGKTPGNLSDVQIELLNKLGMRWESVRDIAWEKNYEAAKKYYLEHGNLLVSANDVKIGGIKLGRWIAQLRAYRKNGIQSAYLTPERIHALDEIGMVWDVADYVWERNYAAAKKYYQKNGNLDVPKGYVDGSGTRLGLWISQIRAARERTNLKPPLSEEQIRQLDELDMNWTVRRKATWEISFAAALRYREKHGNLQIPATFVDENGIALGRWLRRQQTVQLPAERKARLQSIGMNFENEDPWEQKYRLVKKYYEEHGHVRMPNNYVADGVWLRRWLSEQIARLNGKPTGRNKTVKALSQQQVTMLAAVGVHPQEKRSILADAMNQIAFANSSYS